MLAKISLKTGSKNGGHIPESYPLAALLGEISREEDSEGRSMLSVIVVHKHDDMMPGFGFFSLAKDLGRDISDKVKFWIDELERVYEYWSKT